MVVAKYNVKNNSSKTIAEFPKMTIKSTFEHQGMWVYLSNEVGGSFIFHKLLFPSPSLPMPSMAEIVQT